MKLFITIINQTANVSFLWNGWPTSRLTTPQNDSSIKDFKQLIEIHIRQKRIEKTLVHVYILVSMTRAKPGNPFFQKH